MELAPQAGFEPATLRLTAGCSAVELLRNTGRELRVGTKRLFYRPRTGAVNSPLLHLCVKIDLHRPAIRVRHGTAPFGFLRRLHELRGIETFEAVRCPRQL